MNAVRSVPSPRIERQPPTEVATVSRQASALSIPLTTIVLAFAVVVSPLIAFGQNGSVEGRILNQRTGEYISNALVAIKGTDIVSITDEYGAYRLREIPSGPITVRANYVGLAEQEMAVELAPGETKVLDFQLASASAQSGAIQLDKYTVTAIREMDAATMANNEQRYAPAAKKVVAADAFGSVNEGNAGEFMKFLPGVNLIYAAQRASQISLRGLPSSYTPLSIDGERIAASSSSSASRIQETEVISMSNLSRIEVIKVVTPSMSADALGGAVNLISKNAFEHSRREVIVHGFLSWDSMDLSFNKTPGNHTEGSSVPNRKILPGYQFSYIEPLTPDFGFTISSLSSYQVSHLLSGIATWERNTANGGSEANPYIRGIGTNNDPNIGLSQNVALGINYRPVKALTLSAGFRWNNYDLMDYAKRLNINTGSLPTAYDATFTQGRVGAGSVSHNVQYNSKYQNTRAIPFSAKFVQGDWTIDLSGSWSRSTDKYRDIAEGYFNTFSDRIISPTVRLAGPNGISRPTEVTIRNSAGQIVDFTQTSSYVINGATAVPREAKDTILSGKLDIRRSLSFGPYPGAVQFGIALRSQERDRIRDTLSYTFVGADGVAGTADDNLSVIKDDIYVGVDQDNGWGRAFQWPDLRKLYQLYVNHPSYFVFNEPGSYIARASNSERIEENISAAYFQAEVKLLQNRLSLTGGVRFERTEDDGLGLKRDRNAIYRRDASGKIIRDSSNNPILITSDPLEQAKLSYIPRGASSSVSYEDLFPSFAGTWDLRQDLLFRFGYARTMGRPNFTEIIPNYDYDETQPASSNIAGAGVVTLRNPSLKPFFSDNFEVGLEYYFPSGGSVTLAAFQKNMDGAFATMRRSLTSPLLGELSLPANFLNWDAVTTVNLGRTRVSGLEFSAQYTLTALPERIGTLAFFLSGTLLNTSGDTQNLDANALSKKTAGFGISYYKGPVIARLNGAYTGRANLVPQSFAPGALRYDDARLILDLSLEYQVSRHFALTFNAYNLTDEILYNRRFTSANTPAYSTVNNNVWFPMKGTVGIKGTF